MLECRKWLGARVIAGVLLAVSSVAAFAQAAPMPAANPNPTPVGDGTFLLTIFLKHDQSKPLPKINEPCLSGYHPNPLPVVGGNFFA
jgi:hypothetical protein